jgi:hypothetical protein
LAAIRASQAASAWPSLEIAEPGVGPRVGLLQHVLGLGVVPEQAAHEAEQASVVAPHDQLEGEVVAAARPSGEFGVGRGGQRRGNSLGRPRRRFGQRLVMSRG